MVLSLPSVYRQSVQFRVFGSFRRSHPTMSAFRTQSRSASQHDGSSALQTREQYRQPANHLSKPPLLLLEGDNYHVASDGIARTLYRLTSPTQNDVTVEEAYDIENRRKTYNLRQRHGESPITSKDLNNFLAQSLGQSIEIEEILNGVTAGAGTGSMTWDSSIAMALLFSANPSLLRGHIIELGSGLGLGGILCGWLVSGFKAGALVKSLTLTDHNLQVLQRCQENVKKSSRAGVEIGVRSLDWFDFVQDTGKHQNLHGAFDTVVASDCIYRSVDIIPFKMAVLGLLKKDGNSRVHVFGPDTRRALLDFIADLQEMPQLKIHTERIEIERSRILQDFSQPVSKSSSTILHITVQLSQDFFAS